MKSVGEHTQQTAVLPQIAQNSQNLLAEENLPQSAQINTDSLGAEDSSGAILASAAAK